MKKIISLILCLISVLSLCACNKGISGKNNEYTLTDGVYVTEIKAYSGKFTEDGSDEDVENVMSVHLRNDSSTDYQMLEFELACNGETYHFSIKTLFAESEIIVPEKDRKAMPTDIPDEMSFTVSEKIPFENKPSLYKDKLEISYADTLIRVKNLTDKEYKGVFVYYKEMKDDVYFGGITYRVNLGDIPAGETAETLAGKFFTDRMKIVFVTVNE